ncbi:extracellular calcium-sensing receptor-like [Xenopus tropicalis]|uniref:Extracellular calcium-sensing receptor-like n=1 Tax=Xenopus tropicalis TaxID=8364 RepID=A0A8J1J8I3_XENTR|nr:extracellular calcium-sensing receptor-like [Xenopus tropicalis]
MQWVPITLYTIAIAVSPCSESERGCSLSSLSTDGHARRPGDIIIGATFLIHVNRIQSKALFTSQPPELQCQAFGLDYYQSMRALLFAVEEINANPRFLPNITLGFQIFDTCTAVRRAAQGTLWMLSGGQEITSNYNCFPESHLAGIIGDSASVRAIIMAQILGLSRYPQISYLATSPILSNRDLFPSFFRTIPSDEFQAIGLAQLVSHFGWTWVGLLAVDTDYGQFGIQLVKQEIVKAGACVAFSEDIVTGKPNRNAPHIAQVIKASTAKVVIVISADYDLLIVQEELLTQNVTGRIWIASEAWATSTLLSDKKLQAILVGTIGFAIHGGLISGFPEYFKSLSPFDHLYDAFIREFWEQAFSCKWLDDLADNTTFRGCTGNEKMESLKMKIDIRITLNVYSAVYAFAWALKNLIDCKPGTGPFKSGSCANISSFHPWHLLHYIKNVHFETKDKNVIFFDAKGNPPAIYDIVNWRLSATGAMEQVVIGSYSSVAGGEKTLTINNSAITWIYGETQVPLSKCSRSCPVGFMKVALPGKPSCCYDCARCHQGEISNQTDAVVCHQCSPETWPNLQQDQCIPRVIDFLAYEDLLGLSMATMSVSSSAVPLGILSIFIVYQTTPIVRANNYSLSCLLLLSLFLCFLCSLGFIGYPQPEKCLLRQVAFGMVFALCISCVLAKTITVVIAFNATKPGSRLRKWTGVKVSKSVVMFCTCIQFSICVLWVSFSPPFPEQDTKTQPGVIIYSCNEGSPFAFWIMLGYLGLLASISFIVAFLARRLPDSFNEAKLITFSMLAFLSVWVSFIPAYLSARGMYTVAMEVFAILSSSWAVVGCIFVPKCFIVLFRPNMNSREHLMGKGQR